MSGFGSMDETHDHRVLSGADWGIHREFNQADLGGAKSKIDSSSSKSDSRGLELASKPAPYVIWVGCYTNPNEADPHGVPHDSRLQRCPARPGSG